MPVHASRRQFAKHSKGVPLAPKGWSSRENKAICYFSSSGTGTFDILFNFGIREILTSYFYIKKNLSYYDEMLPKFKADGGIFMTDSGAFSFFSMFGEGSPEADKAMTEEFWIPYIEEYVAWIRAHKDYIFSAANMDLDRFVGRDVVDKWNRKYFEPLEKEGIQIIYLAHENETDDKNGLLRLEQYCKKYQYVGVNQRLKKYAGKIYTIVSKYNRRVHGFAWTELGLLKKYPFFSVDSVTWVGGVRFGITYDYDGKNFRSIEGEYKYRRKKKKRMYIENGIDWKDIEDEKYTPINNMNLLGWMGFRKEYMKVANIMLKNKTVNHYERGKDAIH